MKHILCVLAALLGAVSYGASEEALHLTADNVTSLDGGAAFDGGSMVYRFHFDDGRHLDLVQLAPNYWTTEDFKRKEQPIGIEVSKDWEVFWERARLCPDSALERQLISFLQSLATLPRFAEYEDGIRKLATEVESRSISPHMGRMLERTRRPTPAEQRAGVDQPATAPDSKTENDGAHKQESEGCPQ